MWGLGGDQGFKYSKFYRTKYKFYHTTSLGNEINEVSYCRGSVRPSKEFATPPAAIEGVYV